MANNTAINFEKVTKLKPLSTILPASLTKKLKFSPTSTEANFLSNWKKTYSVPEYTSGSLKGGSFPHLIGTEAFVPLHTKSLF